jgi:hypothetical protein
MTLIERFYDIKNETQLAQMAEEHRDRFFSERIMEQQRIVNDNARQSLHYHDIWTYASFMQPAGKQWFSWWMQDLIDAGAYDKVNIVEFVTHFEIPRSAFAGFINEFNMQLFTHYNVDVIFSRDQRLIQNYYSKENEATQTVQVLAAFNEFVATHGSIDTSRIIER